MAFALVGMFVYSCQKESLTQVQEIPQKVIDQLTKMGFNPDGIELTDEGYRIERDIIITDEFLATAGNETRVPGTEQYSTTNLVSTGGSRNITIFAEKRFKGGMIPALDEAIARYNAENLEISFSRVSNARQADIVLKRFSKKEEGGGLLGSAGFPSASGDPYGEIKMWGELDSNPNISTEVLATIIAHEIGHCIGFRHTDYFDRSISCGGSAVDEEDGGVGANHIPGTPEGASDNSWMLSCLDFAYRPFNLDDITALNYLY